MELFFKTLKALKPRIIFDSKLIGFVYIKTIKVGIDGLENLIQIWNQQVFNFENI